MGGEHRGQRDAHYPVTGARSGTDTPSYMAVVVSMRSFIFTTRPSGLYGMMCLPGDRRCARDHPSARPLLEISVFVFADTEWRGRSRCRLIEDRFGANKDLNTRPRKTLNALCKPNVTEANQEHDDRQQMGNTCLVLRVYQHLYVL